MVKKPERLLDLVAELLDAPIPVTAEQIHQRLPGYPPEKDSFQRQFERDKRDLREMGVPIRVEVVPGTLPAEDGYRIDPAEYYLPDPELTADELAALNLAVGVIRLEDDDAKLGLLKLGGAPLQSSSVATLRSSPHLGLVFEAVSTRRRLRFEYNRPRVVDPLRLDHQRGNWYLVGFDLDAGAPRVFRLDRITGDIDADEPASATSEVAEEKQLQLDQWLGDDEPVTARVRVDRPQAHLAVRMLGDSANASWADDGSVELEFTVRRRDGFRSFVIGFLDDAEVLGPPDLRDDVIDWLREIEANGAA